jgi:hypothetical protein
MSVGKRWSKPSLRVFVHGFPIRFSRSENIHVLSTRSPAAGRSRDRPFRCVVNLRRRTPLQGAVRAFVVVEVKVLAQALI